ncbi:hypothetical protein [Nocardia alni]|uniref:hypothetical protein n=1 Tax=Nocardia alni TaxID=2815723 RepID=UPI001C213241|nr:hypothetical protein [Nocardia alni]
MDDMYLPDRIAMRARSYPRQYIFLDQTAELILSTRDSISTMFRACGEGSKLPPPTLAAVTQVPQISAGQSQVFDNYASTAAALQADWESLLTEYNNVLDKVRASATISTECQNGFNTAIAAFNQTVGLPPAGNESEDQYLWTAMDTTVQQVDKLYTAANGDQGSTASGIPSTAGNNNNGSNSDQAAANDLAAQEAADAAAGSGSGASTAVSTDYSSLFPSSSTDGSYTTTGSGGNGTGNSYGSSYGAGNSDIAGELQNAIDSLQNSANDSSGSSGSDMSSLMDSMMLPMMMNQMSGRDNNDSDLNSLRNQGASGSAAQPAPPPVSQSPSSVQATQQPVTPAPPAAPSSPSSTQPTGTPPGQNSDGSVTYTFDDGRTQKVSAIVAQALDAARANADGTDAQAAYAKTSVKWSDAKHIGDAVDPYQLMTGDVATWDNRTAILVVFPPDQASATGSLEVMVQGKLQPFTPEMSDKQGDFGQFNGFAHPHGIEMSADSGAATGVTAAAAAPADPTGGAMSAPAVAAAPTG